MQRMTTGRLPGWKMVCIWIACFGKSNDIGDHCLRDLGILGVVRSVGCVQGSKDITKVAGMESTIMVIAGSINVKVVKIGVICLGILVGDMLALPL